MTQDLIRYDVLVQDALRGVVRKIIAEVIRTGLPGQHHFYISFDTQHPGVRMSTRLKQRYPDEMTVVLQHQFWDLSVTDTAFEVGLSFSGIPERLLIPFTAIKGFFDPSVQFGLQFEVVREGEEADLAELDDDISEPGAAPKVVQGFTPKAVSAPSDEPVAPPPAHAEPVERKKPVLKAVPTPEEAPQPGATVVSLDTFRKKP
jgi:uncharacterized protein